MQRDQMLTRLARIEERVEAIHDRLLYAESAIHHISDHLGINPHDLPHTDPTRELLRPTEDTLRFIVLALLTLGIDTEIPAAPEGFLRG